MKMLNKYASGNNSALSARAITPISAISAIFYAKMTSLN